MKDRSSTGRRLLTQAGLVLGLTWGSLGCLQVPKPCPERVWQACEEGRGTPEAAFEAFRTAVQGNLLAAEYDSFSPEWKAREGLGRAAYLEMRDDLLDRGPFRYALYRSELEWIETQSVDQARVLARFWGYTIDFQLTRKAYIKVMAADGERLEEDYVLRMEDRLAWTESDQALWARAKLESAVDLSSVGSFVLKHEWLIDGLIVHEGDPPDRMPRPAPPVLEP
jgi:hypothetical protein